MTLSPRNLVVGLMAAIGTMAVIVACGSDDESKFKDPDAATPSFLPVDGGMAAGRPPAAAS